MPSVEQNLHQWSRHDWSSRGDEWSVGYGGTDAMWAWTIQPRIAVLLPTDHILEIAPGFGRVTQFLIPACRRLTVVDLTRRCVDACRERFAGVPNIDYHVNDGRSLDMVPDEAVDFAFSWDSLIHAERDVLAAYLDELGRKLKPGGSALLHHSNVDAYRGTDGQLTIDNTHWRAESLSATAFAADANAAGLLCTVQELVPWGGEPFTDCLSLVHRPVRRPWRARKPDVFENRDFFRHVQRHDAAAVRATASRYR